MLHFQADFKAVEDDSKEKGVKIKGYASTKDQDRGDDVVVPGAFEESIKTTYKDNPMILFQHNRDEPIGKAISMEVDSKGLLIEAIIYDEKIGSLVKQGVLKTFSIGYMPKEIEYRDKDDELLDPNDQQQRMRIWVEEGVKRIIKKLELLEVSIVTLPMNASALFSLAKSLDTHFEAQKAEFLSNNTNAMTKTEVKNLLETKEEEAAEEVAEETVGEETTEEINEEETSTEDDSEPTEEAEKEEGEKPSGSEEESEEVEEGEKTDQDEGVEIDTEKEEAEEAADEVEEEETTEDEEEVEDEKSLDLDEKLCTKENLDLALKAAYELKQENAELKAENAELKETLDKLPVKKALAYTTHKLPTASDHAKKVSKKKGKETSEKKGFIDSLLGAAKQ